MKNTALKLSHFRSEATDESKFLKSRKSFLELKQALSCGLCKELAKKPHTLSDCDHTFCFTCTQQLSGKECPLCGVCSKPDAYQPDRLVEKLIEAYLPMATFLGLNSSDLTSKNLNNNLEENQDQNLSAILKNSSEIKGNMRKQEKKINSKKQDASFTHPPCKAESSEKRERKSLNESLNGSVFSVTASKVDKRNAKGETPLQRACLKKDSIKVNELLAMGANVNAQDHGGWTPLHEAVSIGAEEIVRILLENGANPNIPGGQNETPLHDAVAYNRPAIVKLLLSNGADPNARNSRGLTPKELSVDDEMKGMLESVAPVPTTPMSDRLRQRVPTAHQSVLIYFLNTEMKSQQLNKLARSLGFKLAVSHTAQVTHVVVCLNESAHAIKEGYPAIYSAILLGQLIIDYKWIEASEKSGHLEDPTSYELDNMLAPVPPGGTVSRNNAALQLPGLFNNCSFYLHGQFTTPSKADVTQWIKHGSGTVLTRSPNPENVSPSKKIPYHAPATGPLAKCCYFIIYDSDAKTEPSLKYNMSHVKTLSIDWLISCIEKFTLVDPF